MAKLGNRKAAETHMLSVMNLLDPTGRNTANLKAIYAGMSDAEFDTMITQVRNKKASTPYILDHKASSKIDLEYIIKTAEKNLGVKYRQKVRFKEESTGEMYWSNDEFLILDVPVRRLIQSIENKISIASGAQVDAATNQVAGAGKGSGFSAPEALIIEGQGMVQTAREFVVVRGGDAKAKQALDASIRTTNSASLHTVMTYGEGAKAPRTVSHQLTAMHWKNNL